MAKYAGTLLDPLEEDSLLSYGSKDKGKDLHNDTNLAVQIDTLMSKLESNEVRSSSQPPVTIGTGLPALPKKLIARVLANEYIDFLEVPPAKVKGRPMPKSLEGQLIVVQATELLQIRKIIPDLATWMQCFSIYITTLSAKYPPRLPELMAYQAIIASTQKLDQILNGGPSSAWECHNASP